MPKEEFPKALNPNKDSKIHPEDEKAIDHLSQVAWPMIDPQMAKRMAEGLGSIHIGTEEEFRENEKVEIFPERAPLLFKFPSSSIEAHLCEIISDQYTETIDLPKIENMKWDNGSETNVSYSAPTEPEEYALLRQIFEDDVIKLLKMNMLDHATRIFGLALEKENKLVIGTTLQMHFRVINEEIEKLRDEGGTDSESKIKAYEAEMKKLRGEGVVPITDQELEYVLMSVIERVIGNS